MIDPAPPPYRVRSELRPADTEAIVELHARVYSAEHGLDSRFAEHVRVALQSAVERGWPGEREAVRLVEDEGGLAGSVALTDDGDGVATIRFVVLEPRLRGLGLGRSLIGELVTLARTHGFRTLRLETFSELEAAASIYRSHGFELVHSETGPRWGRESLTYQHYELELEVPSRRRATGASADAAVLPTGARSAEI